MIKEIWTQLRVDIFFAGIEKLTTLKKDYSAHTDCWKYWYASSMYRFKTRLDFLDFFSGGGLAPYPKNPGDDKTGATVSIARRYKDKKEDY